MADCKKAARDAHEGLRLLSQEAQRPPRQEHALRVLAASLPAAFSKPCRVSVDRPCQQFVLNGLSRDTSDPAIRFSHSAKLRIPLSHAQQNYHTADSILESRSHLENPLLFSNTILTAPRESHVFPNLRIPLSDGTEHRVELQTFAMPNMDSKFDQAIFPSLPLLTTQQSRLPRVFIVCPPQVEDASVRQPCPTTERLQAAISSVSAMPFSLVNIPLKSYPTPAFPSTKRAPSRPECPNTVTASASLTDAGNDAMDARAKQQLDALRSSLAMKRNKRKYTHERFPERLYRLIREAEQQGNNHIVRFTDDGTRFQILHTKSFEEVILLHYFRHKKIDSFKRLLRMYGFRRVDGTWMQGTFEHPLFQRDAPALCMHIVRLECK